MNVLNKHFDMVYLVTSFSSQERLKDILPYLNKENIHYTLITAPDKRYFSDYYIKGHQIDKGNTSLASANQSILLHAKYNNYKKFCVLEDDIYFEENYQEKVDLFFSCIPKNWQLVNMGWHAHMTYMTDSPVYEKIEKDNNIVGCHMIGYNNVTDFMIRSHKKFKGILDLWLAEKIFYKKRSYLATEKIFLQQSYREEDVDKYEDYKKYKSAIINE